MAWIVMLVGLTLSFVLPPPHDGCKGSATSPPPTLQGGSVCIRVQDPANPLFSTDAYMLAPNATWEQIIARATDEPCVAPLIITLNVFGGLIEDETTQDEGAKMLFELAKQLFSKVSPIGSETARPPSPDDNDGDASALLYDDPMHCLDKYREWIETYVKHRKNRGDDVTWLSLAMPSSEFLPRG